MANIKIYENAENLSIWNQIGKEFYFKEENCRVAFYGDMIEFVELENAMKPGKECEKINIYFEMPHAKVENAKTFLNAMNKLGISNISSLIQLIREDIVELDSDHASQALYVRHIKGSKVFSPFATVKSIKTPKKWTLSHVWKALLSGQIDDAEYRYYYTDDYAGDAADNFRKGWNVDTMELARKLIETTSKGYRVYEESNSNGVIVLGLSQYGFDSKKLVYVE